MGPEFHASKSLATHEQVNVETSRDEGSIPPASTNPSAATWPPPIVARRGPSAGLIHFHAANAVLFCVFGIPPPPKSAGRPLRDFYPKKAQTAPKAQFHGTCRKSVLRAFDAAKHV